ncbi:O-methyltransferase [Ekhidna lutea]|uniref:O-methyltransferase n=1 Tax=Ekhidna lutea TaxID=447679 RepID=UPI0015C63FD1|nr:class I SAM-dependent methyltransferase [Ekhidna lutea]
MKYKWNAVGPHSLHSPFLFDLFNKAVKPARTFRLSTVEKLRKDLEANHEVIDLFDLKTKTSYRRTISSIAKTSLSKPKFSAFLYKLLELLEVEKVLETGTSLGINGLYMAGPERVKKVCTVEASPIIASIAQKQFAKLLQHKIEIKQGTIQDTIEPLLIREQPEFCFIDADHRSSAVLSCVDAIMKHTPKIKCIVVHDIYWSPDMSSVWDKITSDTRFALTIDIFQAGIIFPNMQMPKQHFTLRF